MSFAPSAYSGALSGAAGTSSLGLCIEAGAGSLIEIKALTCKG
jgi:hypothetical protein